MNVDPDSAPGKYPAPIPPASVERVVNELTRRYARDEITEADLENRLERVYASKTLAELESVVSDLVTHQAESTAIIAPPSDRVAAFLSGQERALTGLIPARLDVRARMGYVELDLTRATFGSGTTTIDVRVLMGYVQVRLPPGVQVDHRGRAFLGFFSHKGRGSSRDDDSAPQVRITGRVLMGFAEAIIVTA